MTSSITAVPVQDWTSSAYYKIPVTLSLKTYTHPHMHHLLCMHSYTACRWKSTPPPKNNNNNKTPEKLPVMDCFWDLLLMLFYSKLTSIIINYYSLNVNFRGAMKKITTATASNLSFFQFDKNGQQIINTLCLIRGVNTFNWLGIKHQFTYVNTFKTCFASAFGQTCLSFICFTRLQSKL